VAGLTAFFCSLHNRVATIISATEAARNLGDCLARIRHSGETFIVTNNGKPVAAFGPLPRPRTIALGAIGDLWRDLPVDPTFADDLAAVNDADRPPKNPWA